MGGNHRVTIRIREPGVEKLGLKAYDGTRTSEFKKRILFFHLSEHEVFLVSYHLRDPKVSYDSCSHGSIIKGVLVVPKWFIEFIRRFDHT